MEEKKHSLKVCSTCRHWTPRLKGFCDRLQQGVGKFYICEGWVDPAAAGEDLEDLDHPYHREAARASRR